MAPADLSDREAVERVAASLDDMLRGEATEAAFLLRSLLARAEAAERRLTACGRLNNRHVDKWDEACDRYDALRARLTALAERWERRHGVAVSGDLPPDTWRCAAELRAILKGEHDE